MGSATPCNAMQRLCNVAVTVKAFGKASMPWHRLLMPWQCRVLVCSICNRITDSDVSWEFPKIAGICVIHTDSGHSGIRSLHIECGSCGRRAGVRLHCADGRCEGPLGVYPSFKTSGHKGKSPRLSDMASLQQGKKDELSSPLCGSSQPAIDRHCRHSHGSSNLAL